MLLPTAVSVVLILTTVGETTTDSESGKSENEINCFTDFVDEDGEYFEEDINMPVDTIIKYYDFNETEEDMLRDIFRTNTNCHVNKRAVIDEEHLLWPNATIPYDDRELHHEKKLWIRQAMDMWENTTCLRFVPCDVGCGWHIVFRNRSGKCSSHVGRSYEFQSVHLGGCTKFGTYLHELGHAAGMWHEQSRPDRDSYVRVNFEHITSSKRFNFWKRRETVIDYQGAGYDYGSIMQYSGRAFRNCDSCTTIDVINEAEYMRQGSPPLGQRNNLSQSDITQMNHLYSCPGPGEPGFLVLFIRYATNIGNGNDDLYVRITAVSSSGTNYRKETSVKYNTAHTNWNEWIYFKNDSWQFFRIQMFDEDTDSADDKLSMSETIPLPGRAHPTPMTHYVDTSQIGYVRFHYDLSPQLIKSHLLIYVEKWNKGNVIPDYKPYVEVTGAGSRWPIFTRRAKIRTYSDWFMNLDPSPHMHEWTSLDIQLWDKDNNIKSDLQTIPLYPEQLQHHYKHCDYTNDLCLNITIHLIPYSSECHRNSCCNTTSLYPGLSCLRTLQVHADYGRDIESGNRLRLLLLKFKAFNAKGTAKYKTFSASYNNGSPTWNAIHDFGTDVWTRFTVQLFGTGHLPRSRTVPLTDPQTYDIPPYSYSDRVHLVAGDGHVTFGYTLM